MAFNTNWTSEIPLNRIPPGATVPAITPLVDPQVEEFSLNLLAATYQNATKTTAFTNIGNAVETEIVTNVLEARLGLDPDADTDVNIIITRTKRGYTEFDDNDLVAQYGVGTPVYKVSGRIEWKVN